MKRNKKYYGMAVQAILDTSLDCLFSNGAEEQQDIQSIVDLLNTAELVSMEKDTYYLYDGSKKVAYSGSLERLINKTINTKDGKIYYNNILIWVQNP